jgi:Holliday junction resolvase
LKAKLLLLCLLLLQSSSVAAREKTDVLVMRNGDRLTCEIKSLDSDVLYIRLDYVLGVISVDWSKVDHVESKQLFLVKTQDGSVYSGTLSTGVSSGARPVTIEVLAPSSKKVELDKSQITQMDETAEKFLERFNGQIGLGSIYNRGNQSAQYNLNADVHYPRERWSASASYSSNLSSSNGSSVSTRNEVDLSAQRLLRWNNWYYTGLADFLQSAQQGITLQSTFGGGMGRYLKNTGRASISLTGGFAWQQINYQQGVLTAPTQQVTSGLVASELNLYYFDRTNLTVSAMLLPALSDPGRVHFNLNTSYYVRLWRKKLTWNITFYGNWDNHPPPGFSGADYGSSSGVSWRFGNR